jgi:hypothetical protein
MFDSHSADVISFNCSTGSAGPPPADPSRDGAEAHRRVVADWLASAISSLSSRAQASPWADPADAPSHGAAMAGLPPRTLLRGAMGVGKSTAVLDGLQQASGLVSAVFVPSHDKAQEAAEEFAQRHPNESQRPVTEIVRGRAAQDPDDRARTMCRIPQQAGRVAARGGSIQEDLCARCPFAQDCAWQRQKARLSELAEAEAGRPGGRGLVLFLPHDYAMSGIPGIDQLHLAIFDERPRDLFVRQTATRLAHLVSDWWTDALRPDTRMADGDRADVNDAFRNRTLPAFAGARRIASAPRPFEPGHAGRPGTSSPLEKPTRPRAPPHRPGPATTTPTGRA